MARTRKPISARSTIAHVAKRAGVSTATVSRVLNGNYPVSKEARAKVAQAIEEIDFVQNAQAKALVQAKTGIVGVVMADVSDPFYSEMIGPIQKVCGENGRLLVICSTQGNPDAELSYLQVLRSQRVDAIIVLGGGSDDVMNQASVARQAAALAREGCRLVLCGRPAPETGHDTFAIEVDNFDAARQATRHLMAFGHRKILFLGGPEGSTTSRDRLAGFRSAYGEVGGKLEECTIDSGNFSRQAGYDLVKKHVSGGTPFTAILAASDFMAIGAIRALSSMGLKIPDDLSLIGIDDIPSASDMVPRLSTVRLPLGEMGRLAAGLALELDRLAPTRPLGVTLIPGLTVGPVPILSEASIGKIARSCHARSSVLSVAKAAASPTSQHRADPMSSQQIIDKAEEAEVGRIVLGTRHYAITRNFGILPASLSSAEVSQIAVDRASRVHVLRRGIGVPVVVYGPDGAFVHAYGQGLMFDPHGMTIDHFDRVFIVDRDAHQVLCFDPDGTFRFAFGERHRPKWNAPFNHPTKVAVAADGEIYVADGYGNGCVHRFDSEGRYRSSFGTIGHGTGCFLTPHSVLVDHQDRVVVCDRENNRVQLFDRNGAWTATWDGLSLPMDCCEMPDGVILVTDQVPSVTAFAPDGHRLGRARPSFNGAHGIARDHAESVYLAELRPNSITKLTLIAE